MILYFSGTGNSRFIAHELGKQLKDEVVAINTYLKEGKKGTFESSNSYVFVTPCYMSRMPMKVEKFLFDATFKGNNNAYFVFTAGQAVGNAGKYCKKLCVEQNLLYKGIQAVEMPANYVVMYDVLDKKQASKAAKKALPAIEKIADLIRNGNELDNQGLNGHKMFSALAPVFTSTMAKAKSFYAEDTCISCNKCKELCPLNNISYRQGKPVWGENCMHCMACISACPTQAIQYGKRTKNKNRYYLEEK